MKELWVDAYNEKFDECIGNGMTNDEADKVSIEWANSAYERLIDFAETTRERA